VKSKEDIMSEEKKNEPRYRVRLGAVEAVIWDNEGKKGSWANISLSRTYEDKSGKLQSSNSFSQSQAILAREALDRAIAVLAEQGGES